MTLLQTANEIPLQKFFVPVGVILVILVIGLWIASRVKKRFEADEQPDDLSAGFSLSDLREMVRRGEMSPAEFEKAKQKVIAAARKANERATAGEDVPGDPNSPDP